MGAKGRGVILADGVRSRIGTGTGEWPCPENRLWEASPTPISFTTTNRCGFTASLRGRRPLPQIFWAKP
jgi:hypothetical protein